MTLKKFRIKESTKSAKKKFIKIMMLMAQGIKGLLKQLSSNPLKIHWKIAGTSLEKCIEIQANLFIIIVIRKNIL